MTKLMKLPKLKQKAWKKISRFVRFSTQNEFGLQQCFTCLTWHEPMEMDCGHFIHNKLDFDLRNLKPQCSRCNRWLHGNLGKYSKRLIQENGMEWLEQLEKDALNKGNYYTRQELNEIIEKYK